MSGIVRSFGFMWRRLTIRICEGAVLAACFVMIVIGCGRSWLERKHAEAAGQSGGAASAVVTVTNVVEVTREVAVTNTVIVTVTNFVEVVKPPEQESFTARKTAPYVVTSEVLAGAKLQAKLSECGARLVAVKRLSSAVVEASGKAADRLRGTGMFEVRRMAPAEKVGPLAEGDVVVLPLSSMDAGPVAEAVRALGGTPEAALVDGRSAVRTRLTAEQVSELAGRADVRSIERDGK